MIAKEKNKYVRPNKYIEYFISRSNSSKKSIVYNYMKKKRLFDMDNVRVQFKLHWEVVDVDFR